MRTREEEAQILAELRELNLRLRHIENVTNLLIRVNTKAVPKRRRKRKALP